MLRIDLQVPMEGVRKRPLRRRQTINIGEYLQDPGVISVAAIAVLTVMLGVLLSYRANTRQTELASSVRQAVTDSTRLDADLRKADQLRQRRGEIENRLRALSAIDANRYALPHLMDQASAALVGEVYLTGITAAATSDSTGTRTQLTIDGVAPSPEVASAYAQQLELSPFVAQVTVQSSTSLTVSSSGQTVVQFKLAAMSELPDPSFLETITITPDGRVTPSGTSATSAFADPSLPPGLPPANPEAGFISPAPTSGAPTAIPGVMPGAGTAAATMPAPAPAPYTPLPAAPAAGVTAPRP